MREKGRRGIRERERGEKKGAEKKREKGFEDRAKAGEREADPDVEAERHSGRRMLENEKNRRKRWASGSLCKSDRAAREMV